MLLTLSERMSECAQHLIAYSQVLSLVAALQYLVDFHQCLELTARESFYRHKWWNRINANWVSQTIRWEHRKITYKFTIRKSHTNFLFSIFMIFYLLHLKENQSWFMIHFDLYQHHNFMKCIFVRKNVRI